MPLSRHPCKGGSCRTSSPGSRVATPMPRPIRRLFGRTRLDDPSIRVPEAVTEQGVGPRRDPDPRRCARHSSRRVAAPRRARPHRVRPADPAPRSGKGSIAGAVRAPGERSRGDADTPPGRERLVPGPRHRHDAVAPGTDRVRPRDRAQAAARQHGSGHHAGPRLASRIPHRTTSAEHQRFFHGRVRFARRVELDEPQRDPMRLVRCAKPTRRSRASSAAGSRTRSVIAIGRMPAR